MHKISNQKITLVSLFAFLLLFTVPEALASTSAVLPSPNLAFRDSLVDSGTNRTILGGWSFTGDKAVSLKTEGYRLQPIYQDQKQYRFIRKKWAKWEVSKDGRALGALTVIQAAYLNSDYYYLLRYEPAVTQSVPFSIDLNLTGVDQPFREKHVEYPREISTQNSVWSTEREVNANLPKYTAIVENQQYSLWMSMGNVYRPMEKSTLEERYEKILPVGYNQAGGFRISFPQEKGLIGEQWAIISTEPLVDWNDPQAVDTLRVADLNRARKWSLSGVYYQMPASYYPYTKTNFWRNPAYHIGEKFIRQRGGRLFETFGLLCLYSAVETRNQHGFWWSTPRSGWLYRDYGIDSPFYDTRFNTDAGLFLLRGYAKYQDPVMLAAAEQYAAYLVKFAGSHHTKTKSGGILVYDYGYLHKPGVKTLTSLNHQITEMNFLYEMYLLTGGSTYLQVADQMKKGVKDTVRGWLKPNGDLHYAYLETGEFGKEDYPTLTLNDLRYSQSLLEKVSGFTDPDFQQLIDWKTEYLRKNEIQLN